VSTGTARSRPRPTDRDQPSSAGAQRLGRLLTVAEASDYLNVSQRFIRRLISERRTPVVRLGRHVRLAQADLDAFILAGRIAAAERPELRSHRLLSGGWR
jgi:excisionase family DNA binding protein